MFNNCGCRNNCTVFAILASLIIGFIAILLRITAVITLTPAFLWVVFGIAVVYLGITLLKADDFRSSSFDRCVCQTLSVLYTGLLGAILTSVILLGIEFVATSIIGAILTGALLFFFTLALTSTVCVVKCIANCGE